MQGYEIPVRNERVVNRHVGEEVVAVHPDHATLHALNATASLIWLWVDGKTSVDELARRVAAHYEMPEETVRRDVDELLQELENLDLVTLREPNDR